MLNHNAHGSVTITATAPSEGTHAITAVYEGQGSFLPGTSSDVQLTTGPAVGPFATEVSPVTVAEGGPAQAGTPSGSVAAMELDRIQSAIAEFEPIEWTANPGRHPVRVARVAYWHPLQRVTWTAREGGVRIAAATRPFTSGGVSRSSSRSPSG